MPANLDLLGLDGTKRRKNAERHLQLGGFFAGYRTEASVLRRRRARRLGDRTVQRSDRHYVSDATPQLSEKVDRREYTARLAQVGGRWVQRNLPIFQRRLDGLTRQSQQAAALFRGELRGPGARSLG